MFNLQNHQTIFQELLDECEKRRIEEEVKLTQSIENVFKRVKQIYSAEEDIIRRGLVPEEGCDFYENCFGHVEKYEERILLGLEKSYERAVEFFINEKNKTQIKLAQKGF